MRFFLFLILLFSFSLQLKSQNKSRPIITGGRSAEAYNNLYFGFQSNLKQNSSFYNMQYDFYSGHGKYYGDLGKLSCTYKTGSEEKINFGFKFLELNDIYSEPILNSEYVYFSKIQVLDIDYTNYIDYSYNWVNTEIAIVYKYRNRQTFDEYKYREENFYLPLTFSAGITTLKAGKEYYSKLLDDAEKRVTGLDLGIGTNIKYNKANFQISLYSKARIISGNYLLGIINTELNFIYHIIPEKRWNEVYLYLSPLSLVASIGAENIFFKSKEDMNSWASVGLKMYLF